MNKPELKQYSQKLDGWLNALSLLGTARDKKTNLKFKFQGILPQTTLNELYRGEGFARKIIDRAVYDMIREWFTVEGDTDSEFNKVYKKIKFKKALIEHLTWDRLHGGSVLVAFIQDGGELWEPLNITRMKKIDSFKVYDKWRVFVQHDYYNLDPTNENFGNADFYDITPVIGDPFLVHYSRIHVLDGCLITDNERYSNEGWGDSALQAPYNYIKSLANNYSNVESVIEDFVQAVMSIDNLQQLIMTGREDLIKKRIEILDLSRSVINTLLIDTKEKYEKKTATVTGLPDVMQEFGIALAGVTDMPATLLLGRSPAGENATGEMDIRNWYDKIAFIQEMKMLPVLDWINGIIVLCSEYSKIPKTEEAIVDFTPLWQPSQKEIVDNRKIQAETDNIYWNMNVLDNNEVRDNRFGGATYSFDTVVTGKIETEDIDPDEDIEEE